MQPLHSVCPHGSTFGSVNFSKHTGHAKMSPPTAFCIKSDAEFGKLISEKVIQSNACFQVTSTAVDRVEKQTERPPAWACVTTACVNQQATDSVDEQV